MKSFQRYLDVVVAILSFGLLISLWPYRDTVVHDAYAATTTDIGNIAQINVVGFHNIETNEQGVNFRWGRQYVTLPIALPRMKNNAAVVSLYGTTLTTQSVNLTLGDNIRTSVVIQGGAFRTYHLLVNHTGLHHAQTSITFTTAESQIIKGQELGIALGNITFTPLKTAFATHLSQRVSFIFDQFGMLLVAACVLIIIARAITPATTAQLLIRIISSVSMMVSMYLSAQLPFSVLLGTLIVLVPLVITPHQLTLTPSMRAFVTRSPHLMVYLLFVIVAVVHLLVDTKATLCTLNSYIPCVNHTWNFATGDEPSYIRVAKNIKYLGTSMVDFDADATKKYYVHSIGVSLLIVPTIVDIDILWTRISFILINGVVALLLYQLTGGIKLTNHAPLTIVQRIAITTVLVLAMPFIPAANQLYPDLIAGVCLLGVWYWVTNLSRTSPWFHLPFVVMMVASPWLHTKYFYISLGIAPVIGYALWRQQSTRLAGAFAGSYLVSVALVMWYGQTAWGNPFGPVTSGSAPFTLDGISRVFGLIFDQNQGILWQNPLHVLGLCGLGLFYRRHRSLFWAWGWLFGVPLVLNALHVNPYGGISYSGRFHWSSAVMLYAVTVTMVVWLMMRMPTLTTRILVASLMVQSYFWYMYSTQTVLYPRAVSETLLLDHYTIMFGVLEPYLPQFYSLTVSLATPANYIWIGLIIGAMIIVNYRMRHERFVTAT